MIWMKARLLSPQAPDWLPHLWCSNMMFLLLPQLRKVERDKKTMDQEIVDLTNKLLDAKNTIDRLEELNVSLTRPPCCWLAYPDIRTPTVTNHLSSCLKLTNPTSKGRS